MMNRTIFYFLYFKFLNIDLNDEQNYLLLSLFLIFQYWFSSNWSHRSVADNAGMLVTKVAKMMSANIGRKTTSNWHGLSHFLSNADWDADDEVMQLQLLKIWKYIK